MAQGWYLAFRVFGEGVLNPKSLGAGPGLQKLFLGLWATDSR